MAMVSFAMGFSCSVGFPYGCCANLRRFCMASFSVSALSEIYFAGTKGPIVFGGGMSNRSYYNKLLFFSPVKSLTGQ